LDFTSDQAKKPFREILNRFVNAAQQLFSAGDTLTQYTKVPVRSQAAFKLDQLKRERFAQAGRDRRISASLAALNAPQPTNLSLSKWKEILKEIEDEE